MTDDFPLVSAQWLALRESADAAARAAQLVARIRPRSAGPPLMVHDLGSGTGSMGRWLAPRLAGPQQWVLHDRDADLLRRAAAHMPSAAADGSPIAVATNQCDITRLTAADLGGADVITASALLDMFTADEIDRVVSACAAVGCPLLFTISVTGRVDLTPADPLDATIMEAFNAHQRRTLGDRPLLGPDAVEAAVKAFARHGLEVQVQPSPWRLGRPDTQLIVRWLAGWVGAATEQRPELAPMAAPYLTHRRAQAVAGRLSVLVHHDDLLAEPGLGRARASW